MVQSETPRRAALVTGGARGIGRAACLALAAEGMDIAVNYAGSAAAAEQTAADCRALGVQAVALQADVRRPEACKQLIEDAAAAFGRLDVLVNNAGVAPKVRADLLDMSEESFDYVVGINTKGNMFLTQLVAKQIIAHEPVDGRNAAIVNVSSCSSVVSSTNRGEYCVSKAGVSMLTTLYADRLWQLGQHDIVLVTENRAGGTSRNTGSDKQTYYKLTLSGGEPDSVREMADTLFAGRCVDGDLALCEAALSSQCFLKLVELGVPFPRNRYGEYIGYKTDHDPRRRATSVGPYTSKQMTECLEAAVQAKMLETIQQQEDEDELLQGKFTAQLQEDEDELMQGKFAAQLQEDDEDGLLQGKFAAQLQEEDDELLQG